MMWGDEERRPAPIIFRVSLLVDVLGAEHPIECDAIDQPDEVMIATHYLKDPAVLQVRALRVNGTRGSYVNPLYR